MTIGQDCWRDRSGVANAALPFRVRLPDGSTRTDPTQWSEDAAVLEATGWSRSVVVQSDLPPAEVLVVDEDNDVPQQEVVDV
jgi:hypothetical protein